MATTDNRKYNGRPKGSSNLKTRALEERLQTHMLKKFGIEDYDPVIALAEIAEDKAVSLELRASCHKSIIPYIHAAKKAVEISGPDGGAIEIKGSLIDSIVSALEADDEEVEKKD